MDARVRDLFGRANLGEKISSIVRLERGYSNRCFRVTTEEGNSYKVRIADNNYVISRSNELCVLRNAGIEYLYYDSETGDSVWSWVEGHDLTGEKITGEILDGLVVITEEVHRGGTEGVLNHDDLEYVEMGAECLSPEDLRFYRELVHKYSGDSRCLCHNDISLSNLIYDPSSGKLSFIDYEWGRVNNPYWDYGNFVKESDLSEENIGMLSSRANLDLRKLYEFAIMASYYSLQLSYVFREQTAGLDQYRRRLLLQLDKYREWLSRG